MNDFFRFISPTRRVLLVGGASSVLLAGCGGLIGPTDASAQIYVLAPDFHALPDTAKVSWGLSVARPEASESLNTERIALRRGETMDYFADAQWADAAPQLLQMLLVEAFEKSGGIDAVAKDVESIRADYILQSELRAFEARYDSDNGAPTIVVDIMAKLLVARTREVAAAHDAQQESQAAANSVAAVVAAFGTSMSLAVEDIVAWALGVRSSAS